jgi:hypothetical protein
MRQRIPRVTAEVAGAPRPAPSRIIFGLCLVKLGKHLAVLACLLILGQAAGRLHVSQLAIFALIVLSAISYSSGKSYLATALAQLNRP